MFTENQRLFSKSGDANAIAMSVASALQHRQVTAYAQGTLVEGTAPPSHGLTPRVRITTYPVEGGHFVDVAVAGDFDTNAMILGVVMLVLFWPLVLIFGYLAYDGFKKRARDCIDVTQWALTQLDQSTPHGPAPAGSPVPPASAQPI